MSKARRGSEEVAIEAIALEKEFGHVRALQGASLRVHRGEVVALVGDNGAGKSTFLKTLAGVHAPDAGELRILGTAVTLSSVRDAHALGVQVVYQDLALAPDLSVAESMFLGHERRSRRWSRLGVLDRRAMADDASEALRRLGVSLPDVEVDIASLSGGQRQAVAIARAVRWAKGVLLMDEPTAALGVRQTEIVTDVIRAAANEGLAVLVISHDMPHMLKTADRIAVLRHGRVVSDRPAAEMDITKIVGSMLGMEAMEAAADVR